MGNVSNRTLALYRGQPNLATFNIGSNDMKIGTTHKLVQIHKRYKFVMYFYCFLDELYVVSILSIIHDP